MLIVKPDRQTDADKSSSAPALSNAIQEDHRRKTHASTRQRMRVGQNGLLRSTDRTHTVAVLYSLDARRVAGRLPLAEPGAARPPWLVRGSRLWLYDYNGLPLRIRLTVVKPRREGYKNDEQFAEFVVHERTGTA